MLMFNANGYQGRIISKIAKRTINNHSLPQSKQKKTQAIYIQEKQTSLFYVNGTKEKIYS